MKGAAPLYALDELPTYVPDAYTESVRRQKENFVFHQTMQNNRYNTQQENEAYEREIYINTYDPCAFDELLMHYFSHAVIPRNNLDMLEDPLEVISFLPPYVVHFCFGDFNKCALNLGLQNATYAWIESNLSLDRNKKKKNPVSTDPEQYKYSLWEYDDICLEASIPNPISGTRGPKEGYLIYWSLVLRMQIIFDILIGPPRPRPLIPSAQTPLGGSPTNDPDGYVENDQVIYWLHMWADAHIPLIVEMEDKKIWDDVSLMAIPLPPPIQDSNLADEKDEILKKPMMSIIESFIPSCQYVFHEGMMKDITSYINYIGLWGAKDNPTRKLVPLVHFMTKSLPQRCLVRNILSIFEDYARKDESFYEIVVSWLVATLLGSYQSARVRPGLVARKMIYNMFFFYQIKMDEVMEWLNPAFLSNMSKREVTEAYASILMPPPSTIPPIHTPKKEDDPVQTSTKVQPPPSSSREKNISPSAKRRKPTKKQSTTSKNPFITSNSDSDEESDFELSESETDDTDIKNEDGDDVDDITWMDCSIEGVNNESTPVASPLPFHWDEVQYNENIAKGLSGAETRVKSRGGRKRKHPPVIKPSSINHQWLLLYCVREAIVHGVDYMPHLEGVLGKISEWSQFRCVVYGTMDEMRYMINKQMPLSLVSPSSSHNITGKASITDPKIKLSAFGGIPKLIKGNSSLLPKQLYSVMACDFPQFIDNKIIDQIDDIRYACISGGKLFQRGNYSQNYEAERIRKGTKSITTYKKSAKKALMEKLDRLSTVIDPTSSFVTGIYHWDLYKEISDSIFQKKERPSLKIIEKYGVPGFVVNELLAVEDDYTKEGKKSKVLSIYKALTPYCYEVVRYFYRTVYTFESVRAYPLLDWMKDRLDKALKRQYSNLLTPTGELPSHAGTILVCLHCRKPKCPIVKPGGDIKVHETGHDCTLLEYDPFSNKNMPDYTIFCTRKNTQKRNQSKKTSGIFSVPLTEEQVVKNYKKISKSLRKARVSEDCSKTPLMKVDLKSYVLQFFGKLLMMCPECASVMTFSAHRFHGDRIACGSCRAWSSDPINPMPGSVLYMSMRKEIRNEQKKRITNGSVPKYMDPQDASIEIAQRNKDDIYGESHWQQCVYCYRMFDAKDPREKKWARYESEGKCYILCKSHNPAWIRKSNPPPTFEMAMMGLEQNWKGVKIGNTGEMIPIPKKKKAAIYSGRL